MKKLRRLTGVILMAFFAIDSLFQLMTLSLLEFYVGAFFILIWLAVEHIGEK
jgi:hypothetical protein